MTSLDRVRAAAEARLRTGGFNGFSFRDIARDADLTNAGVHHYFPTKTDLLVRLVKDYTERFRDALHDCPAEVKVERLTDLFADSLRQDGKMCLCGLLAAESGGLPAPVAEAARTFFETLSDCLSDAFPDRNDPGSEALRVLAQLEGAALVATLYSDPLVFEELARHAR